MTVLDTNVLFALMRKAPDPVVVGWLNRQPADSIWITSVTLFEHRVLDLDAPAAGEAAALAVRRQKAGRPIDVRDTVIAGIIRARRATLATRNVKHFGDLDVPVVDPWEGESE